MSELTSVRGLDRIRTRWIDSVREMMGYRDCGAGKSDHV